MSNNKNMSSAFESTTLIVMPKEEWLKIAAAQEEILQALRRLQNGKKEIIQVKNITALEFMAAVRIRRTKFDQLVANNKIKTIKKGRKIYVPISEVDRYFQDTSIK